MEVAVLKTINQLCERKSLTPHLLFVSFKKKAGFKTLPFLLLSKAYLTGRLRHFFQYAPLGRRMRQIVFKIILISNEIELFKAYQWSSLTRSE